ncbi:nuclease-related domain-containing protein [Sphingobium sp. HBC34]|jgi:hypothetical protein|uniref:Nuclease-related domain-containing protein n=1 Tax=Sphingobium cyanobacteriorum TaxID=3063954 RepID=A0ABT8ZQR0_9SPHN|nr:nuclease-related domain-containing protein [Sphingobium sp. HBC34]MDO7836879.1 nuclease-related domain-containing protein [Sphingobium sp. HBC34]
MIIKRSTKADELAFLEEVIADEDFTSLPATTQSRLRKHRRGLWGERATAHMIDRHLLTSDNTAVIHDLRIADQGGSFAQFDHLLLNRWAKRATIVEVKNYAGRLSKNDHGEWMVWYTGQRRPRDIPNPVEQARRQAEVLRRWLIRNALDKVFPRVDVFVSVPPECSIDRSKVGTDEPLVKSDNLISRWLETSGLSELDVMFSIGVISSSDLRAYAQKLARAHVAGPDIYDVLNIRPQGEASVQGPEHPSVNVPDTTTILATQEAVDGSR